jgi:hypothetical protein
MIPQDGGLFPFLSTRYFTNHNFQDTDSHTQFFAVKEHIRDEGQGWTTACNGGMELSNGVET